MGVCSYILSGTCPGVTGVPKFQVRVANEHRNGKTKVSYTKRVEVDVFSHTIVMKKNGIVLVSDLPPQLSRATAAEHCSRRDSSWTTS